MEPMTPLYLFSLLICCVVLVYDYIDGKRSDADFTAFFEADLKEDQLAAAQKEIERLTTELDLIKSRGTENKT